MKKEKYNIACAYIAVELVKICREHPTSNRYQGVGYGVNASTPPVEVFNAVYRYLCEKLDEKNNI